MQVPWRQLLLTLPPVKLGMHKQRHFVDHLIEEGYLRTPKLITVILSIDRSDFGCTESPFNPCPIGHEESLSAFNVHAMACEALYPALVRPNAHILDVGCGSGYLTAVFARLNPSATVYGVDCKPEMIEVAQRSLAKEHGDLMRASRIVLHTSDGAQGYPPGAPYDAIHVGVAVESLPETLLQQLRGDGILVAPVGPPNVIQDLVTVTKKGELTKKMTAKSMAFVRFEPMIPAFPQ